MIIENNIIIADTGKIIYRVSDDTIMGPDVILGVNDSVLNYAERELTTEEKEKYKDRLWLIQKV